MSSQSKLAYDNRLLQNMLGNCESPTLLSYYNPIAQSDRILPDQASLCCDSEKALSCSVITSSALDDIPTPKSSAELEEEIATLELEIMHLERHLLSLYRTAFQGCALPNTPDRHVQFMKRSPSKTVLKQPHPQLELQVHKGGRFQHEQTSPAYSQLNSDHHSKTTTIKVTPKRDQKVADSCHRSRSLGDHLGASRIDSSLSTPDRVSEDIVRCISSIYCKLATPQAQAALSASPTSSLSSSSIFSSKNPCESWSPHCNDYSMADHEGFKDNNGPYTSMIEVLKICLDDDSFNYAAQMLQNFRSLVRSLEKVDVLKMKREEKLAFWINIHNALVMHAFLAYGTHNRARSTLILKAAYNIGGHFVNAYVIQSSILGIRAHHAAPWLQSLLNSGKKLKTGSLKHIYALEYPEPLVHFALCSGAYSDPAVRAYTAKGIFQDLKLAKREFIQASIYTDNDTKVYLPKILQYFAKDMSLSIHGLLEEIEDCISEIQKKAIGSCVKGRLDKSVHWQPQSQTFRYVIHEELATVRIATE
ncbi:uncharacterized protein LOC126793595 isoform X2 [Argentina anserina]|uniref:uncharacterized protein LOC126793595 isoform X2 n=1 Tax=Argentina anserina TaxID=57926 RepID=UPI00217634E9|nr:uncharacterized protein LOC126793595 isoform X2 [Potentilla anserina]